MNRHKNKFTHNINVTQNIEIHTMCIYISIYTPSKLIRLFLPNGTEPLIPQPVVDQPMAQWFAQG